MTGNCSVPQKLIAALTDYARDLKDVTLYQALTVPSVDYVNPNLKGHLRVNTWFISANVRQAVHDGRADFTPAFLSEIPLFFKRNLIPLDVALMHISPPDEDGNCTLGVESGLSGTAARCAKMVIAEVNEQMPAMMGDTCINVREIDALVPVDYPVAEMYFKLDGEDEEIESIAKHIADVIPDGATMQMGIGAIPDAILKYLMNKKDLGIHSELFSDGVIQLVEAGVVTGKRKTLNPGKITAGFVIGTQKLYQWADHNPLIELRPSEYVNNPFVIAQNARMVAINSAIEIDFTGQVCADSIGTKFYSGVGGQHDFIYGAALSEGGIPIIALTSTATLRDGTRVSRIMPTLKQGAGVTVTRNLVHYVVTEYGMVNLYGKPIRQRTRDLISIAHPDFREQLERQAWDMRYLSN